MTAQELTRTVRELKELKAMTADLTAEITNLVDILKAEMAARGTDLILPVLGLGISDSRIV